jgi:hypothetical protein
MDEDWSILLSFFPDNWAELASSTDALKGLRKDKATENYLRTLLIHVGCGYSLRETVARAKMANLADITDVALVKRLRKAKEWLHSLCLALLKEQGIALAPIEGFEPRLFDATNVKEPGKTGSLWRIHYSVQLPSLNCDFFKITPSKGTGTGESFFQYSIKKGDFIIADRGYSTASGIHHVVSKNAYVMVRVNTSSLPLLDLSGQDFDLLNAVSNIEKPGIVKSWPVLVPTKSGATTPGRICVIRKGQEAIKLAHKKIENNASKKSKTIKPETYEYAKYVIVFTNYPEQRFPDVEILNWYRSRWQVELVFKRFKSIAHLGHLPKHSDESSKAWLYGKLLVALLTMKLVKYASSISPWGYDLGSSPAQEPLA